MDKTLYIILILTNLLSNITYRFYTTPASMLFYRYFILSICSLGFIIYRKLNIAGFNKKYFLMTILRASVTFLAQIVELKQIEKCTFINTTLIYCSIPIFDSLISYLLKKNSRYILYKLVYLANLTVLVYNIFNFNVDQYIYGYLASFMFSISNIIFIKQKEEIINNQASDKVVKNPPIYFIILWDLFLFSMVINCLTIWFFGFCNIINSTIRYVSIFNGFIGMSITIVIYFLFFFSNYNPSFVISNLDLFLSLIVDFYLFNKQPSFITLFVIIIMLYTSYKQYGKNILNK